MKKLSLAKNGFWLVPVVERPKDWQSLGLRELQQEDCASVKRDLAQNRRSRELLTEPEPSNLILPDGRFVVSAIERKRIAQLLGKFFDPAYYSIRVAPRSTPLNGEFGE